MENVRECPFCGGEANITSNYSAKHKCFYTYVRCKACLSTGKPFMSEENPKSKAYNLPICESACKAWNDRKGGINEAPI